MPIEAAAVDIIEKQEWLEPVEGGLQKAVQRAYAAGGPAGRRIRNFMHGTWLGHPLHPVVTDVPIGAWTAALVLDAMDERAADAVVAVGLAGALAAVVPGLTDWHSTTGNPRRLGLVHGLMNIATAGLYAASLVARKNGARGRGRLLSTLGYGMLMGAAYLGGKLVYGMQIGVNHTAGEQPPREFVPVLPEFELREGQPRRVMAGDAKVLLVRRDGNIHAIAEVCSHLGGPLAEGILEDDEIQCPWHGSRFSVKDGHVVDGPATHKQPLYETRVRNGQIEVRAVANLE
jgi:nitrite reductase/ring-hydroxylating ferredoxin subunit